MKKTLFLSLMTIALFAMPAVFKSNEAKGQLTTVLTPIAANDTLTNTDTAWVYVTTNSTASKTFSSTASVTDNISRSVTVRVVKVSGTVAGSVTVQGSNDATNWETVGSALTLTDVADQVKTVELRSLSNNLIFKYYRALFLCSGTNVHIPSVYYLRRSN